jgi:hypothetical protein
MDEHRPLINIEKNNGGGIQPGGTPENRERGEDLTPSTYVKYNKNKFLYLDFCFDVFLNFNEFFQ